MAVNIYLNELSICDWDCGIQQAKEYINDLLRVIIELHHLGAENSLYYPQELLNIELINSYSLVIWLADESNDIDLRRRLRSIITKAPYFESIDAPDKNDIEVLYSNNNSQGFLFTYLYHGISVSFQTKDEWRQPNVNIQVNSINESGDIIENHTALRHIGDIRHVINHRSYIQDRAEEDIQCGHDLVTRLGDLYQHVTLCRQAHNTIKDLHPRDAHLSAVTNVFRLLNNYISDLSDTEAFDISQLGFDASYESISTMQHYSNERTFSCPDGNSIVFNEHAKINPGAWRIYFSYTKITKKVLIGYVGCHLRTTKHH